MIIKVLFQLFIAYLLYKLVFDFIIPVYKTTKQVRQKVNEMHNNMHGQGQANTHTNTSSSKYSPPKDDYIDFEEVKGRG